MLYETGRGDGRGTDLGEEDLNQNLGNKHFVPIDL